MGKSKAIAKMTAAAIMVIVIVVAAVAGTFYYLSLPRETGPTVEQVEIGYLTYLTGDMAWYGDQGLKGMKFAVDEINELGGIHSLGGAKLVVHIADCGATGDTASSALRRLLAEHPNICGIVGSLWSGTAMVLAQITEREEVPLVSGPMVDSITDQGYRYFFRISPRNALMAQWQWDAYDLMHSEYGAPLERVGWCQDDNPAATARGSALKTICESHGVNWAFEEMYVKPLVDPTPIVMKMLDSDLDWVSFYIGAATEQIQILTKMVELGWNGTHPIASISAALAGTPAYLEQVGDFIVGAVYVAEIGFAMEGFTAKEQEMLAMYPEYKFVPKDVLCAYSWTWAMKAGIEVAASVDREKVRAAFENMNLTDPNDPATGMAVKFNMGSLAFDEKHDCESWKRGLLFQWQEVTVNGTKILKPLCVVPEEFAVAQLWQGST